MVSDCDYIYSLCLLFCYRTSTWIFYVSPHEKHEFVKSNFFTKNSHWQKILEMLLIVLIKIELILLLTFKPNSDWRWKIYFTIHETSLSYRITEFINWIEPALKLGRSFWTWNFTVLSDWLLISGLMAGSIAKFLLYNS